MDDYCLLSFSLTLELTSRRLWAVMFLNVFEEESKLVLLGVSVGMRKFELLYYYLLGSRLFFL